MKVNALLHTVNTITTGYLTRTTHLHLCADHYETFYQRPLCVLVNLCNHNTSMAAPIQNEIYNPPLLEIMVIYS